MELGIISVSPKFRLSPVSSEKNNDHQFLQRNTTNSTCYSPRMSLSSGNLSDKSNFSATSPVTASGYRSLSPTFSGAKRTTLGELSFCNSTDSDETEEECFCEHTKDAGDKFMITDRPTIFNDYRNNINNNNLVNIKYSGVENKLNNMKAISLINHFKMPYNRLPSFDTDRL